MNICYIIGAGECAPMDFDPGETDLLIAADGGYRAVCDAGMRPDLIVGDFDSLGGVPTDAPVIRCPVEKDDTDTMIAIKEGLARGYQRFQIYGGLGIIPLPTCTHWPILQTMARAAGWSACGNMWISSRQAHQRSITRGAASFPFSRGAETPPASR